MLVVNDLSFERDPNTCVLEKISLTVNKGEFVSLVGASGTGKTTLLRCLSGVNELHSGQIIVAGQDVTQCSISKRSIVHMQQEFPLYEHLSIWDNVVVAVGGRRVSNQIRSEAIRLLELAEIPKHFLKRFPKTLSSGEAQRVVLCKTLLSPAKVLLLDEPFSSLNKELKQKLGKVILQRIKERGQAVVFVSHDELDVATLSNRVYKLENGELFPYDVFSNIRQILAHQKGSDISSENDLQPV
ncbi:MAG: ATP-binding cassette domain-containing protein [Cyanobacteria bacterium J06650_10]